LAGGVFFMKDGANTTGNVTLTVYNSAVPPVPLGSITLNNSQFCGIATGPACQSYFYRTFAFGSPLPLFPGSYTLVLSSDATPQQNTAYFVKGGGTSFTVAANPPLIPDLSVVKIASPANLTAGSSATYGIQVINVGNTPTSSPITVTDILDPNLMFMGATPPTGWICSVAAQVVTCTTSSAVIQPGPGNAAIIMITVKVAANAPASVTNAVRVDGGGGTNTNNSFQLVSPVSAPNLSVSKTASPATFTQGQTGVIYTLIVSNSGSVPSSGMITVTDMLDPNLTFGNATGAGWTCTAPVVTCTTTAAIAAGGSAPAINITVNVAPNAPASITNNVTVTGGGGVNTNNSFQLVSTVNAPKLSVSKTASPLTFSRLQNGVYTILVSNGGTAPSSGTITVTDALVQGLTFVSASGSGWLCTNPPAQVVTCTTSAAIPAGASASPIMITVTVGTNAPDLVMNNVTVSGGGSANTSSLLVTSVDAVDLTILKTATPTTFTQGQNGVYTITASNIGNVASSGLITVVDTLDPNLTLVGPPPNGSNWSCIVAGQIVTCTTSAPIPAGGAAPLIMINVNVRANGQTTVTNRVEISGGDNMNTTNASFTLVSNVNTPDLTVSKSANPATFTQGQNGVYTITASNVGTAASSGVITVTDTLGPNLTFGGASGSGWSCVAGGQVVTCTTSAPIPAGAAAPLIMVTVNVGASAGSSVTNTVTIAGGGQSNTSNSSFQLVTNVTTTGPPVQTVPATTTPVLILAGMALIGIVVWLWRRAAYPG
jgi:uncharacterized repeat protein (TIGR01451 family)